jgi:hypothetical protein
LSFRHSKQNLVCISLLPHVWNISIHLALLDFITLITFGKEHKSQRSLSYNGLQPYVTSCLLGPNIFLSTLFSKTLKLCHSLSVRYNVSHMCKTRDKQEETGIKNVPSRWVSEQKNWCKRIICEMFAEPANSGKSIVRSPFPTSLALKHLSLAH